MMNESFITIENKRVDVIESWNHVVLVIVQSLDVTDKFFIICVDLAL